MNRDPREQSGRPDLRERTGWVAPQERTGWVVPQQPPAPQRRWGCCLGLLIALLAVIVLLVSLPSLVNLVQTGTTQTTSLPQHTLKVSTEPQLVIKDFAGVITLQAGSKDTINVSAIERRSQGNNQSDIQYAVTQNGNTVEVTVDKTGTFPASESVDLAITLPAASDIQVNTGAGNINTAGISGLMNFQTNAGDISFQNGTIKGASSFQSNAGLITFDGSLALNGNYTFNTHAGSIDISLPADSAFTLDASTGTGNVSNDFSSNSVGSNPTSQLHVHANVGNVSIHRK